MGSTIRRNSKIGYFLTTKWGFDLYTATYCLLSLHVFQADSKVSLVARIGSFLSTEASKLVYNATVLPILAIVILRGAVYFTETDCNASKIDLYLIPGLDFNSFPSSILFFTILPQFYQFTRVKCKKQEQDFSSKG